MVNYWTGDVDGWFTFSILKMLKKALEGKAGENIKNAVDLVKTKKDIEKARETEIRRDKKVPSLSAARNISSISMSDNLSGRAANIILKKYICTASNTHWLI